MAGGCEGSVMMSCTGETLNALLRAHGDGVLAPLVLAMAEAKKFERMGRGVRGAIPQMDVLWTSLGDGALNWSNFALGGAFRRSKYLCKMKHINLEI